MKNMNNNMNYCNVEKQEAASNSFFDLIYLKIH